MGHWWSEPTTKHAYILAVVGLVIEFIAAAGGVALFVMTDSPLILCYSLENIVDFMSSAVVLWRFFAPELNDEIEKKLQGREKRASVAISFILIALGGFIIATGVDDIKEGMEEEEKLRALLGVSVGSIFIFGFMTILKFHYSIVLKSASLQKDGICSLIGTILSAALFVNTMIIKHVPEAWWIDPAVALACGVGSIVIGLHSIIVAACFQKLPIHRFEWWWYSQGDGTDEITGRDLTPADYEMEPPKVQVSEVI